MWGWLRRLRGAAAVPAIPQPLWSQTLADYPFLAQRPADEQARLRQLSAEFLARKEFHGAQGLVITDAMAVAIAAQACLPVLHLGVGTQPLDWYDDFVGIVVHPDEVLAQRERVDAMGVVHQYSEVLAGEAMEGGPVMLSWQDVAAAGAAAEQGYNVVIHEFIHKIDLRDGLPDGCPPLSPGFMGASTRRQARQLWLDIVQAAYDEFREQVIRAERFGTPTPWLDPYGATAIDEFFAVAAEAYFVNRLGLLADCPRLPALFDAFFHPRR